MVLYFRGRLPLSGFGAVGGVIGDGGALAAAYVLAEGDAFTSGTGISGAVDAKVGIFSCSIKKRGNDGTLQSLFTSDQNTGEKGINVELTAGNKVRIFGNNAADAEILSILTNTSLTADSTWHHMAGAWDLSSASAVLFFDGISDLAAGPTLTDDDIDYTKNRKRSGSHNDASNDLDADLSEFYLNIAEGTSAFDISNFYSGGLPFDLGADGSAGTGTQPAFYMPDCDFADNKGSGGNMTNFGVVVGGDGPGA